MCRRRDGVAADRQSRVARSQGTAALRILAAGVVGAAALLVVARAVDAGIQAFGRHIVITAPGVPGPYCVYGIEKRVRELGGIERVELLWTEDKIRVELAPGSSVSSADVRRAIERAEYPYDYAIEP